MSVIPIFYFIFFSLHQYANWSFDFSQKIVHVASIKNGASFTHKTEATSKKIKNTKEEIVMTVTTTSEKDLTRKWTKLEKSVKSEEKRKECLFMYFSLAVLAY